MVLLGLARSGDRVERKRVDGHSNKALALLELRQALALGLGGCRRAEHSLIASKQQSLLTLVRAVNF